MLYNYNEFKSLQDLYRSNPIRDNNLLDKVNCMLPYFLCIDENKTTLDHFLYDESFKEYLDSFKGDQVVCPLCGCNLQQNASLFECLSCNTLFNPIDNYASSLITSIPYNTMKSTECQEKNQNFEENFSASNKDLQTNDLETLDYYLEKYTHEPITDPKMLKKVESLLPKYLHIDKKNKTLDHFYYDNSIVDHLQKSDKGGFICPICHSGLGANRSGAFSYKEESHFFKCFSCGRLFFPLDHSNLPLNFSSNNSNQETREAFQENIEEFHNELQEQDLGLSRDERKAFIEATFSNRGYGSETIDYVLNNKHFLVANDEYGYRKLFVVMFDTNLHDPIGYQKLYFSDRKEKLTKYNQKGSILGLTLFSDPNYLNCVFIVESVANALAIFECGFNAICCYTCEEQPYKAYKSLLQNGLHPILFLDRNAVVMDQNYFSINWQKDIESNFLPNELKENADASDLLKISKQFLSDLLRNLYNTFYKKQCFTDITIEEAFESKAKLTIIQAPIGIGKTTNAIKVLKEAVNPLLAVCTKEQTVETGSQLDSNVVNSDTPIIKDINKGVVTTHARLGKTTQLQDFAVFGEDPIDIAVIDETHKFLAEQQITIAQPYFLEESKEEVKDYQKVINNESLTKYQKEGTSVELIAYKREENNQAIYPIKMGKDIPSINVQKLQKIYLDREYTVNEFADPANYPIKIEGTTNIYARKIDENLAHWLSQYSINADLKTMLTYDYNEIKKELSEKFKTIFGSSIRNISLPLAMLFFRNCYVVCAFPIREKDNKPLSFDEWKENIRNKVKMVDPNNDAVYFKVYLRFVNLEPLVKILKKAQRIYFISASDFIYKDAFLSEFKALYGDNFKYYNLASNGIKELKTSLVKLKKIEDKELLETMKNTASLECNSVVVFPKYDRADEIYQKQKAYNINDFSRATKEGCKTFFTDTTELESIDNKTKDKQYKNIIVHANAPILESSNRLAYYTLMMLDCNYYKPKIAYANPFLQDIGITITETLKIKLIQTIGRLYRQKGNIVVIVLMNYKAVEFDIVSFLREKSEVVNVYEDSENYTFYKDPKSFSDNIANGLQGKDLTKYKVKRLRKASEEAKEVRKEERKEEIKEKKELKEIQMIENGASERELKQNIRDYKERSELEWLALNKKMIFKAHKPIGENPFADNILNSKYVSYDTEVFPNYFVICFHDEKGQGYSIENPCYEWLSHFWMLPLIGFNNAFYDNPILLKALILSHPNYALIRKEKFDFNKELKAFSDRIINTDIMKDKELYYFHKKACAIGLGDVREMVTKHLKGESESGLKSFQLDLGLSIMETPYNFDTNLTYQQVDDVKKYCLNDDLTVHLLIKKYQDIFQASLMFADQAGLNGNYPISKLSPEIVYNKELTHSQRRQDNLLTTKVISDIYPHFKVIPGMPKDQRYVNEFDDYLYILGDGGFNLLPENCFCKVRKGSEIELVPIELNHGHYKKVLDIDISSLHPHTVLITNYFGKYTPNYKRYIEMKNICSNVSKNGFEFTKKELEKFGFNPKNEKEIKNIRNFIKLFLNSTYGLTHMDYVTDLCKCEDNIIAIIGSCFVTTLHHELIHNFPGIEIIQIKTDSIKIADYTEEIEKFCNDFAKEHGYTFETEAIFKSIVCKGNEYIALNSKGEIEIKGSSFQVLTDDHGNLRNKNNLRTLLIKRKQKTTIHKLGLMQEEGNKITFKYVADVKSHKVAYYLPVKDSCKEGLYPYYVKENGQLSAVNGLKNQKVIAIYDLKELDNIDRSIIDYDFFKNIVNEKLDLVINLMLFNKNKQELINSLKKQNYAKRISMKLPYLNEEEKNFFSTIKEYFAFE